MTREVPFEDLNIPPDEGVHRSFGWEFANSTVALTVEDANTLHEYAFSAQLKMLKAPGRPWRVTGITRMA